MASRPRLQKAVECRNSLGEGVLWDGDANAALWTDIEGSALYRSRFPFVEHERFDAPERIGSFGLVGGRPDELVVAFESGFALYGIDTASVLWLDRPELPAGARFNDGRVDRSGEFWAGVMIENPDLAGGASGALFRLRGGKRAQRVIDDVRIPNSLCWSPDGSVMYFADTPRDMIWAFDVEDGEPTNRRAFARTSGGGHPDGSTVDADGYLWNAEWGAGRVVRYTPDGRIDLTLEVPAPHTSCVAFGGPALEHILVTTARVELTDDELARAPQSGNLFVFESAIRGLPESRCALDGAGA